MDTASLVDFPLIPRHVTLNDLEWICYVKLCFAPVGLELFAWISKTIHFTVVLILSVNGALQIAFL